MKIYIAQWPDNSISILTAQSKKDLELKLDSEANPAEAKIKEYSFPTQDFHITTHFNFNKDNTLNMIDGNPDFKFDHSADSWAEPKVRTVKIN